LRAKQGSELKRVEGFRPDQGWVLDAGDMLYLPPGIPHEGVAVGECMTYSIGFRASDFQQLLEPWFADYAERVSVNGRYVDSGRSASARPAELPVSMTRGIHAELARHQPTRSHTERFLLRHLTEPKATTVFEPPVRPWTLPRFRRAALSRGLTLDRRTRALYAADTIGINGEAAVLVPGAIAPLKKFADQRELAPPLPAHPAAMWRLLHDWYAAGWIALRT
jgi:50S ribosomal protein L16 3-hydroxylase